MKADKTYYLENGELTDQEPATGIVLINKGQDIPKEMADKYGIGQQQVAQDEAETVEKPKPSSNKSKSPKENK